MDKFCDFVLHLSRHIIYLRYKFLFFCLFLSTTALSQPCNYKHLVFEGAGIRGIAYAGVVKELENEGILKNIEKVGGTSAGAITALLVSLGYTSDEILEITSTTKLNRFNDGRFFFIGGLIRTTKVYGWYRGEKFTKWIANLIEQKTGNSEITFEELNRSSYKDLYVTATCLNQQKLIIISHENYPKMKVKDAIRVSMSIPLYFRAVFVDSSGRVYKKPAAGRDVMIDGGITGNFPIFIFDTLEQDSNGIKVRIPEKATIGVRMDIREQIHNDSTTKELVYQEIKNFRDYISAAYIYILENLNRNQLTQEDWERTIAVSSEGITPRIKRLSIKEKESLVQSGRKFTSRYFKNRCN